jgi:sulfur-carrier protein
MSAEVLTGVTVRYFAAAQEAAGVGSEVVTAPTLGELRALLVQTHGEGLGTVLRRCSLLVDGVRTSEDDAPLTAGATVDVLPPFAGG